MTEALSDGQVKLNLRLRYETVDWQGLEDADAFTLRTRLTFNTGQYKGLGATLEMDDVQALGQADYRTAGNDPEPVGGAIIADPQGTEVNQAYLSYQGPAQTAVKYGRQRIVLDNQRFVGAVAWRQNEQTYDAFSLTSQALDESTFFYAYIHNVNRVFGEQNPIGDHKHQSHLVNFHYTGWDLGELSLYAYLLDNETDPTLSSESYGARWLGKLGPVFSYTLEYATQTDFADHPDTYRAGYMLAEAVADFPAADVTIGYERLGSDDGKVAFNTPLATLHKFQGWTDRFLTTPAAGVEDWYLGVSGAIQTVKLSASYHDLGSDYGHSDYGQEVDFSVAKTFGDWSVLVKYANYQADGFGSDTDKLWLMLSAAF